MLLCHNIELFLDVLWVWYIPFFLKSRCFCTFLQGLKLDQVSYFVSFSKILQFPAESDVRDASLCVPGWCPYCRAVAVLSYSLWCDCVFYDHRDREREVTLSVQVWDCVMTFGEVNVCIVIALHFPVQHLLLCRHRFSFSCLPRCCWKWNTKLSLTVFFFCFLFFLSAVGREGGNVWFLNTFRWIEIKRQIVKDTGDASAVSTAVSLRICAASVEITSWVLPWKHNQLVGFLV